MLPRFELGHLIGVASLTETAHHEASPGRILGRLVVAPVAVNACHPVPSHRAFPPGYDEVRLNLFVATDTGSIILLGGNSLEVQGENDQDKPYRIDPTTVASAFHKALPR